MAIYLRLTIQRLSNSIIKSFKKKISNNKNKKIIEMFSTKKVIKRHFTLLKIKKKYWMI